MKIQAKQRLLADEGQGQTAPAQVIAEELVAAWKRMMPTSTAFARPTALNPSDIRMHGWYIKFKIAGSKEEVANSIWENDMLSLMFMIDPQNDGTFEVECGGTMGSVTTKATEKYMAYGREKLRKYVAKGDAAKVTKQATAYLQKVKETISRLVQEDRMPDVPFDWHKKLGLSGHDAKARLLAVPSLRQQFEGPEGMLEDADDDGSAVETDSESE